MQYQREANLEKEKYFEECIVNYGKSLYLYIFSLVKHKELAEDLYQEVLLSAFSALPGFEEKAKLRSWLYTIAMNKCRDYWRKEKLQKQFWEEKVFLFTENSTISCPPEEAVLEVCSKIEMEATLQSLPKKYREPLWLFYFKQQSLKEISDLTSTPISTVKTRMKRAKNYLRPKIEYLVANQ
ncbi:RNA polymerase sigma factor [Bacillus sp. S/N-304-OC-R1]|uniref:RNA polymerase sigma factor n=1 Tax=Bacillus sp. S/N-304-OC-R1 TaxID=2758034 RepID=UPI001C8D7FD3|nr:RNA polymerase sigma factor [Bacillus sp. S/N-304-OC-R1]MBY0122990.1 RNA polymerase sigma factor [Bacillus sp. S/N-304-OC-R1]